ncbi:hypothetical protein M1146_00625 [Patescibacteria group bacterium]|nr:hypothetical protein [Patescibacteria group bacterium]
MRRAFVEELKVNARNNKNIILLTADLGYTVFEEFKDEFPKQYFNVGVAESNMIGVATGLALSGKIVFTYSIASFASLKTVEQIRNDACVHNAPVIIIGSGSGLSYSNSGPTHHTIEDLAIMRTLPNITVFSPGDPWEVRWCIKQAIKLKRPVYIRLGKKGEQNVYTKLPNLIIGKPSVLTNGNDFLIIATGNVLYNCLEAQGMLRKIGLEGTTVSLHTIKPLRNNSLANLLKKYKHVFTVEEHSLLGGLGTIISEVITDNNISGVTLNKIGIKDTFTFTAGDQNYIRELYGLTPDKISKKITKIING